MSRLETTVTQKGQVTIPQEIREAMGLKPRDRVRFVIEDGRVVLWRAESAILAGYGSAAPRHRPEDWRAVRQEVEQAIARDVADEARPNDRTTTS
jgi:antitoxin PrlF